MYRQVRVRPTKQKQFGWNTNSWQQCVAEQIHWNLKEVGVRTNLRGENFAQPGFTSSL